MKPILIFRHVACEGPGYLASFLRRRDLPFRLVRIDAGEPVPEQPEEASALVFMGGPMSVNDPLPWVRAELALIGRAAERGLPMLGHCLGGQLLARALGGSVQGNPVREIGWHPVESTDSGAARHWLQGLPRRFEVFHWHGETYTPPPGAERLLSSRHCAEQGFARGTVLGLQCHVEMTAPMIREWTTLYGDELAPASESVQTPEAITTRLDERLAALHAVADALYSRWVEALG